MVDIQPVKLAAPAARVLAVVMAVLALWVDGRPIEPQLAYLGTGYLVLALLSVRPAVRDDDWLAYPLTVVDAGVMITFIVLSPLVSLPLWVLYLLPIAGAATVGRRPALLTSNLSLLGYLVASWLTAGSFPLDSIWSAMLLAIAGFMAAGLARRRTTDARLDAEARSVARDGLRRERALRQAMADLAGTLDGGVSRQIVLDAVRAGLDATVSIVDRSSFRVVAGDPEGSSVLAPRNQPPWRTWILSRLQAGPDAHRHPGAAVRRREGSSSAAARSGRNRRRWSRG